MDKRITLVTGASRGIGQAAALELARRGHHVVATARSKLALEKLDDEIKALGGTATLVPMDLKDKTAFETLGQALATKFGRLDGLLGNAGVLGTLGPLQAIGPRSFEETIEVNLTANWRLIRAMAPLLQRSEAPRAVFISSGVVPRPRAFWGPYQASKMGLEGLAFAWADENENLPLRVNIFDPGATRTGMRAEAMPSEDPMSLPAPEEVVQQLVPLLEESETRTGERIVFAK
ncbi:SDR family NAD(P)-dependent oxidoreductase [Henriciella mobilis]|uniref:SDR family NAD(P)-dependent oxidoreductase n=1 Tax=Henriciella mobilis TaxID=2305467 RepID=UPI000E665C25|nr:SDR family NAD(P)-dependent oxidoreductase [Henriciella mobilis]RIJ15682.1 SDR family NAD(P)-dependent oxidoreductase [Henriciella mobilis]RIJ19146.1 SDR family NAD(P)-dependent oxidoreductase [Henriciella mobilis]